MKKKLIAVLAGAMVISSLAGCSKLSGSKELSNDNIKISQYKGVEAEKAEIAEVTEENVDEEIQSVLYANRIVNDVSDRPAQSGDTVSTTIREQAKEESSTPVHWMLRSEAEV